MIIEPMNTALNGIAQVPHLGVIRVEGEDAAKFLHAQLTQDFALLGLSEARLAAFCSAKGRMLASFVGFKRSQGEILLVCSRDILAPVVKRLSMFVLRAKARLTNASDAFVLRGLAGSSVVQLAAGGNSWSSMSDRNVKENLQAVDPRQVLEKVSRLSVTEWNLTTQPASVRHLGPMAQDFKAAFGLGEDDRHISGSDADGVALAAIQGLNQKLEETVKLKETEIRQLKERLAALEQAVSTLVKKEAAAR